MSYKLPPLPYSYDALEPYIDAQTMELHYTKHHQKYIDELNKALEGHPALAEKSLHDLISMVQQIDPAIATQVRNNAGGSYNHALFWQLMRPHAQQKPIGYLHQELNQVFGSFDAFKNVFDKAAKEVFGSGWAWLCLDKQGKLCITKTANQDNPLMDGLHPILGLDVWEHAYYLKYQNRRVDYITAWWHVVNWEQAEENYRSVTR